MEKQQRRTVIEAVDIVQKISGKVVIDGISLELFAGELMGIFGTRGTGKTTLLHILAGIDRFSAGKLEVLGCNIRKNCKYKKSIGLVSQEKSLFRDLNTMENLDFIATLKEARRENISELIERFELKPFLHEAVDRLDAGVYQRLALACAMLDKPQILIVDEVIKDIDLYSRHIIIKQIQEFLAAGGACIYGFSNMEYWEYADRIGWLENGQLEIYTPQDAANRWNSMCASFAEREGMPDV